MSRCERCDYSLVRHTCPICGGKQIQGVEEIMAETGTTATPNNIAETIRLYWSPSTC